MSNVASLHILPGVEYNDMPSPALPALPPVTPEEVPTSNKAPKLLNLLRNRNMRRLIDAETEYIDDSRHDTVIKATALGAQLRRGFSMKGYKYPDGTTGATVEPKHVQPQTLRESLTSNWRQGQVLRRDHRHHESERIKEKYTKKPSAKDFLPDDYDSLPLIKQRAAMNEAKKKVRLHPGEFTLGTSEHLQQLRGVRDDSGRVVVPRAEMPASARKSQEKHIRKYRRDHNRSHDLQHSLDKGAKGDTIAGLYREHKITKAERKIFKLQRKADNYDRLAYIKARNAESAKSNPDAQELDDLQFDFGQKWADDIHRQLVRSKQGRAIISDYNDRMSYINNRDAELAKSNPDAQELDDLQFDFGQKWADDIHQTLKETNHGRTIIEDKGRRVQDGRKA